MKNITNLASLPAPELLIGRYRLLFSTERSRSDDEEEFFGSAWRGAFGHALKRSVCITGEAHCSHCPYYRACAYPYLFDTPLPRDAEKMRRYSNIPHPYVLVLPFRGMPREERIVTLGFNLFGRGVESVAQAVHALRLGGEGGVGRRREVLHLQDCRQHDGEGWRSILGPGGTLLPLRVNSPPAPPLPESITLRFESPLRIVRDGSLLDADALTFADLFGALLRRLSMLSYFHTSTPLETDFRALTQAAREIEADTSSLRRQSGRRYSTRQKRAMKTDGLLGTVRLDPAALAPFWPYLWLGQWSHVGKLTTMGLGRYRIEETASLPFSRPLAAVGSM